MRKEKQRGVTLLELLVSIAIVSLLATTALLAWRVSISGWERARVQLERGGAVLAVHQLLTEQIASMTPYQTTVARVGRVLFFQGEAETVRFVSRYSLTARAASGLYLVEYHAVEQRGGTWQLLLQEKPLKGYEELSAMIVGREQESGVLRTRFRPFEQGEAAVVLLEGLEECRFEYYRRAVPGVPGGWTSEWSGAGNELPTAMRVRATAREEAGILKPVVVTAAVRNYALRQRQQRRAGVFGP